MDKDIFEGAKFGDKFVTRDGRIAIYHEFDGHKHRLIVEGSVNQPYCLDNGHDMSKQEKDKPSVLDIVSRYEEPIDECKLDEEAKDFAYKEVSSHYEAVFHKPLPTNRENFGFISCEKAYKAGYRSAFNNKAKDE